MTDLPRESWVKEPAAPQPYGEILDLGYRHYEGSRGSHAEAIRALIVYSIKRGLGIKKRWTAKIIPAVLYLAAFVPVIVIIGILSLASAAPNKPAFSYFEMYTLISLIIPLFAAATAPEMLCDDRRERVLQLYFSRSISRFDYLVAKIGALGLLIGAIAFLPALLLFLGNTFLDADPLSYIAHNFDDLWRILASGSLIALLYASITLAVSAYINRKGIAAAVSVGGILIFAGIVSALFDAVNPNWQRFVILANPLMIPEGLLRWIFDYTIANGSQVERAGLNGAWYVLSVALVLVVCGAVMYRRYLVED